MVRPSGLHGMIAKWASRLSERSSNCTFEAEMETQVLSMADSSGRSFPHQHGGIRGPIAAGRAPVAAELSPGREIWEALAHGSRSLRFPACLSHAL